ncbi:anthranilate synthase component I family protein [Aquiflexum gelatinilyticum]|uniref:Anthranilate synthase component I family protein n=1 Tax=Aquiflexum gelatinilyticum TaxID=2961943 RepID=A0A9X2P5A4_9BACT|nr:anthranilate synthase component I family protein [Aquiflexum gelatinilyticum]MCR9013905.1 anthranilate synthase component I family protein [Aquiflexum gelatinilyticum]
MSEKFEFPIPDHPDWKNHLLRWFDLNYSYFSFFQNNQISYPHGGFSNEILAGQRTMTLEETDQYYGKKELVGIISYDYKNKVEKLRSNNPVPVDCPESLFFIPEIKIEIGKNNFTVFHPEGKRIGEEIRESIQVILNNPKVKVNPLTTEQDYFSAIKAIQNHIEEGDMYELNFCMAFNFESQNWNPITGFRDLMEKSPMPFSSLFKAKDKYLIGASPERFLKKAGNKLIAQPIKGTIKRGKDAAEDEILKNQLLNSEKERAENLMIVDLMRNDLSKISETGSVDVEELFGVYPFAKVHQMISTVSSTIKNEVGLKEIFHATFPMGSMTGAPKIKCMELIEQYENFQRGWFSGTLGHIHPNGDFDFNVVIRSIIFDRNAGKGYFAVGSAITYDADAGYEYEECLLKASAIMEVLEGK